MQSLKDYHGQVILAGINYDSTDSTRMIIKGIAAV